MNFKKPITVALQSKAWTVFASSNAGIVGSNHTQGMDACVFILCVGGGLATGWSPVQGVLPTVYRSKKLKKRPRSNKGLQSNSNNNNYKIDVFQYILQNTTI
jgi:hypothetical protein